MSKNNDVEMDGVQCDRKLIEPSDSAVAGDGRISVDDAKPPLPTMGGEAVYRIRVRGTVGSDWARRLESMEVARETRPDGEVESVLAGRLTDQAASSGVLNTLYERHMPVVSLECLEA